MTNNQISNIHKNSGFLIVGLGASAGGIKALKSFFQHVPKDSGMAYVVILHLSPDMDSKLAEILQKQASIPVFQIQDEKVKIQADQVYVIPPNKSLKIQDDFLVLSEIQSYEERRAPVDIFFRTLAESHKKRAVAIILSGAGANGSMGIRRIKELGGAVIVQDPTEAEFPDMPNHSIEQDIVDYILPVTDIPNHLNRFQHQYRIVRSTSSENILKQPSDEDALLKVFSELRTHTGHDFSNYKRATLLRRIERRMNILRIKSLPAYAQFLSESKVEPKTLLKDLLISVTNFFRDKEAFKALKEVVLPKILEGKTGMETVRIWIPGCATGEEAYSFAILLSEYTMNITDPPKIQIFSTDIDEKALNTARAGYYTNSDVADVSPERLLRFFVKEGKGYRVRRELREMILFVQQNLILDPPFSRVDLVSCRNLLIYLNRKAQARVMETIHFSLNPGGFLFLGSCESVDSAGDLYTEINKEQCIFQSRAVLTRPIPPLPEVNFTIREIRNPMDTYIPEKPSKVSLANLHHHLLELYAPPSILVNSEYDIVHLSKNAGKYLQIVGGEPSYNLLKIARQELRMELHTALSSASQNLIEVRANNISVSMEDDQNFVNIIVRPVINELEVARGFLMVIFEPTTPETKMPVNSLEIKSTPIPIAQKLEEELVRVRAQLHITSGRYEMQTEELKASNEELQAINEELRSAAEELETSREELQSTNEELATVNQELKLKISELSIVNNNFQNLINSTDIGTIFLDKSFCIKLFTPAVKEIFNVIQNDYGRPLSDITHKLKNADILKDASVVLEEMRPLEKEVELMDKTVYLMRILPYQTIENLTDGVVITFVDITDRKQSENRLKDSNVQIKEILESINDAFYAVDEDYNFVYVNKKAEELLHKKQEYLIGKNLWREIPDVMGDEAFEMHKKAMGEKTSIYYETISPFLKHWIEVSIYPNKSGGLSCYFQDINQRKKIEEALRSSEEHYKAIVNQAAAGVAKKDLQGRFLFVNQHFCKIVGYSEEELLNKSIEEITHEEDIAKTKELFEGMIAFGEPYDLEKRYIRKDGSVCWVHNNATLIKDENGEIEAALTVVIDLTESKIALEKAGVSETNLSIALEAAEMATWDWHVPSGKVVCNRQFFYLLGVDRRQKLELRKIEDFLNYVHPDDQDELKERLQNSIDYDVPLEVDFRIIRADNQKVRWLHCYGKVVEKLDGTPIRIPGVMSDITKQKILEKQKDDFLGIASHELKTPVTSIKAYNQLLQTILEESGEDVAKDMLDKMHGQVDRLIALINDLLDATRLSEGKLELRKSKIDLNAMIEETVEMMRFGTEHITILTETQQLPLIDVDAQRLEEVLINLISNATKYATDSQKIIVKTILKENEVQVAVQDFGPGITEEIQKKVFERFFRGENKIAGTFSGLGLGLYISSEIIKQHEGRIWVESKMGEGATFYFTLPLNNK